MGVKLRIPRPRCAMAKRARDEPLPRHPLRAAAPAARATGVALEIGERPANGAIMGGTDGLRNILCADPVEDGN